MVTSRQATMRNAMAEAGLVGRLPPSLDPRPITAADLEERERKANRAFLASLVDPFGIPSAAVGLISPETRDAWRGVQSSDPAPAVAGSLMGGLGLGGLAMAGAKTVGGMIARGMPMAIGGDVVDQAAGLDAIDGNTALAGALAMAPGAGNAMRAMKAAPKTTAAAAGGLTLAAPAVAGGDGASSDDVVIAPSLGTDDPDAIRAKLARMGKDDVKKYQRAIGLPEAEVDGVAGKATRSKALQYESRQAASRGVDGQASIIRAKGEADAAARRAEIREQEEQKRINDQRSFAERNPELAMMFPAIGYAAAATVPGLYQASKAARSMQPARVAARDLSAIGGRNPSNAMEAASLAAAATKYDDALSSYKPPSGIGLDDVATSAASAASVPGSLMAPSLIDYYTMPASSDAYKAAAEQMTPQKFVERLFGPTASGLTIAGLSGVAGRAYGNFSVPSPSPGSYSRGEAARRMMTPDGAADAQNFGASMQSTARGNRSAAAAGSDDALAAATKAEADAIASQGRVATSADDEQIYQAYLRKVLGHAKSNEVIEGMGRSGRVANATTDLDIARRSGEQSVVSAAAGRDSQAARLEAWLQQQRVQRTNRQEDESLLQQIIENERVAMARQIPEPAPTTPQTLPVQGQPAPSTYPVQSQPSPPQTQNPIPPAVPNQGQPLPPAGGQLPMPAPLPNPSPSPSPRYTARHSGAAKDGFEQVMMRHSGGAAPNPSDLSAVTSVLQQEFARRGLPAPADHIIAGRAKETVNILNKLKQSGRSVTDTDLIALAFGRSNTLSIPASIGAASTLSPEFQQAVEQYGQMVRDMDGDGDIDADDIALMQQTQRR